MTVHVVMTTIHVLRANAGQYRLLEAVENLPEAVATRLLHLPLCHAFLVGVCNYDDSFSYTILNTNLDLYFQIQKQE